MRNSRIPNFYDFSVFQRLDILKENGFLEQEDIKKLIAGEYDLKSEAANKMIENVIASFSLPLGLALNLQVNSKDYVVPLVVEEPSIVAALSASSKIVRNSGGFIAESTRPVLIGQILLINAEHPFNAKESILNHKTEILALANYLQPKMNARGGGAIDLDVRIHPGTAKYGDLIVVHIYVDTKDAMGANMVNSICEGIAPMLEKISNASSFMRILSNLHDRSIATSTCTIPMEFLKSPKHTGEELADGIVLANYFASVDPYRAATHNKGIMNGIDPLAIATGNDWRAIEAGVHAFAARGEVYTSLTNWYIDNENNLVGKIKVPLKVGIVGAPLQSNPMIKLVHKILGITSANELMELMASVGLAQNFAALKALVSEGIQRGHMSLHARSVARAAGISEQHFDFVVDELIKSGEIKIWKAKEIMDNMTKILNEEESRKEIDESELHSGFGKVILFGEHAVVYGSNAIAAPISFAIKSKVEKAESCSSIVIPRWGVEFELFRKGENKNSLISALELILMKMNLHNEKLQILVFPHIPRAMGLGGSAALAVSVIRALSAFSSMNLTDSQVNDLAYEAEKVVHGTPSGIDNTMATYGKLIRYKKDADPQTYPIHTPIKIPLIIGLSGSEGLTLNMVRKVREGWNKNKTLYDSIFNQINEITLQAIDAINDYDLEKLGYLMNLNQGLLNAIQVSTPELEEMIALTRRNGALGAKLTGGGGGGAMICLCPENRNLISQALNDAGYHTIITDI
ncbi:MAG: hydroxymethylglutaryl-CoA reductase [Ignavibacteria bacterium GWF2_33_9]|nr:MAG: hydroxymethylglutaryl-CoA reductase [Ignavibacteria bacterium GWF2_33_9]